MLYLHGFASSPYGEKATRITELVAPHGIELHRPDLNVPSFAQLDFDAMVERAAATAEKIKPRVIVGSSRGGLVALALTHRGFRAPLVLIAPALGIADRWREKTPSGELISVFHHGAKCEMPIHRRFFERMMSVVIDEATPLDPVTIFMGCLDDSVPYESVAKRWREWVDSRALPKPSRMVSLGHGDHGLTAFVPDIAEEIILRVNAARPNS